MDYRARYVEYDPRLRNWDEKLDEARRDRPAGEVGTLIALPAGGRLRPPKAQNETPAPEKAKRR
jgi:hypothetical protein